MPTPDSLRREAIQFFEDLSEDFDTKADLFWAFVFEGATVENAEDLQSQLQNLGFPEVEIIATEDIDIDDLDSASLGFFVREKCIHTAATFSARVLACQEFAAKNRLELVDFSAGIE